MSQQSVPGMDIVIGARNNTLIAGLQATREAVKATANEMRASGKEAASALSRDWKTGVMSAAEAAAQLKRQVGETTVSAGAALRGLTEPVRGVGAALKGVQQASGAAFGALNLLGEKVAPQFGAITNAISGLVAGGFTPLGVGIAAATAGIGLLASNMDDALSPAAKAAADRLAALKKELAEIRVEIRAAQTGRTTTQQERVDTEKGLRTRATEASAAIDAERRYIAALRMELDTRQDLTAAEVGQRKSEIAESERQVAARQRVIVAIDRELQALTAVVSEDEKRTKELEKQNALLEVRKRGMPLDAEDWRTDLMTPEVVRAMDYEARKAYEKRLERQAAAMSARQWDPDNMPGTDPQDDLMPDARGVAAEERERDARIRRELDAVQKRQTEDWQTPGLGDDIEEMTAQIKEAKRELTAVETLGANVSSTIGEGFVSAFESAARGAKGLADVLADVGDSLLSLGLQFVAKGLGGALMSGLGADATTIKEFGFIAPQPRAAAAAGGSWRVGGSGGTDSKYLGMALTPGELVEVSRPGEERGGGVDVIVNNYSGQQATQKRSRGANGREVIEVTVGQAAAADLDKGGPLSRSLERNYGMRRSPRRG